MGELSIIEYVGSVGGVAGVLAVLVALFCKHLIGQMRDDRKFMEDRMTGLISNYSQICRDNNDATVKHSQIQTELITWLKARNGHN